MEESIKNKLFELSYDYFNQKHILDAMDKYGFDPNLIGDAFMAGAVSQQTEISRLRSENDQLRRDYLELKHKKE